MSELKPKQDISIEIVSGAEGPCLLVNDYRISGPKPWGGGAVTHTFTAKLTDIERAVYGNRRAQPVNEPLTLEQLREMNGEPVWVSDIKEWAIVAVDANGHWAGMPFVMGRGFNYDVKMRELTCYRRPPERSENE